MRLISLNTWGGTVHEPFRDFIAKEAATTDIFCFQEIIRVAPEDKHRGEPKHGDLVFTDLEEILSGHTAHFAMTHEKYNWREVDFQLFFGNAMFIRNDLPVVTENNRFVHGGENTHNVEELNAKNWTSIPRLAQHIKIRSENGIETSIFNFHGLWEQTGKGDTPGRLEQFRKLKSFVDAEKGRKILCGDFNADPDTESMRMLENDMRNLITEYRVDTTRSAKLYPRQAAKPFADYMLVTPDIEVKSFSVPKIDVSDHLPMVLEFT